jgi:DNA invertase Pin-like site-specific DNA recombinase
MLEHAVRGEAHYLAKLTADKVRQIRDLRQQGVAYQRIADMFGVSFGAVYRIVKRKSWKHVQ